MKDVMAIPKKIKLNKQESLIIEWDNGKVINYPLTFLRDESPDAGNKGETILWKHYAPPPKGPDKPGKYEIANIKKVGNYAITITWKDGENAGIYSWELLERFADLLEIKQNLSSNKN
ncbi:MAG: DUF971 domain-containing protein [Melioribacteraceae bacterium]|nr:DUF971 domain-containing protein [Melioribacteraceae bacterium]